MNADLPWYVELLGEDTDSPGLARLIAEFDLAEEPLTPSRGWFENERRGFSVSWDEGRIETIHLMAADGDGTGSFDGPLPLGLAFAQTKDEVFARLGPPDHAVEAQYGRTTVVRYDVGSAWVAIRFDNASGCMRSVLLESRACAAKHISRS